MSAPEQPSSEPRREPKVVKRYANRKLYDTEESRYITLDEIAEMIRAGSEIKVVDNRNQDDLTSVTLAQIIFEQEKKTPLLPLGAFRDIIRNRGEHLSDFLQTHVTPRVASIRDEAGELRDRLLSREDAARPAGTIDQARELSQKVLDDLQKRLDERIHQALEKVTSLPALIRDVAALERRLRELEKRLDQLDPKP
jgi:polyhydroxyalkanoate synthesis repressor PhaR